jgi:hypothetical protein
MARSVSVKWLAAPEAHDYPAAASYLGLIFPAPLIKQLVARLKRAPAVEFKAKDIFRASQLPLLPLTNIHVRRDQKKLLKGQALSPLLLVRDPSNARVVIADGYHRLCAVYALDEDAVIPCRIV